MPDAKKSGIQINQDFGCLILRCFLHLLQKWLAYLLAGGFDGFNPELDWRFLEQHFAFLFHSFSDGGPATKVDVF